MDKQAIYSEFNERVNMAPKELEEWLETEDSKSVGAGKGSESTGHESGRKIVAIKHTKKADLSDADYKHMEKVIGYIKRHLAQGPEHSAENSRWRFSLMNWGHDPLK